MSAEVLYHLLNRENLTVEAGTGVGKSFAYIIAAFVYSYLTGERVLVSTETRNLQMQLIEKDLPQICRILGLNNEFEMALGSGNYLCELRYRDTFDSGKFLDVISAEEVKKFDGWANEIFSGNKQGHIFEYKGELNERFWRLIGRDPDRCPSGKCEFYSGCNYFRARANWANARVLVVNHHLILFHLLNDKKTLPPFGAVVFDEAHGFLKTGFSIFTISYSRESIIENKKNYEKLIRGMKNIPAEKSAELIELMKRIEQKWDYFFSHWEVELNLNFEENKTEIIQKQVPAETSEILSILEELTSELDDLVEEETESATLNQLMGFQKHFKRTIKYFNQFSKIDNSRFVYWGEKKDGVFKLQTCNLKLGDELKDLMLETTVWTSATLGYWPKPSLPSTVQEMLKLGYFQNFLKYSVPAGEKKTGQKLFFSPFEYSSQAVLYIPEKLEMPNWNADSAAKAEYTEKLFSEIADLIHLSQGGALVLFTSNYMLAEATEYLSENLDLEVFSQLHGGAVAALNDFKAAPNSVLLGTTSFWQGIDIAGVGLRMLVITKLMFTPPDDPIFQARSRIIENEGQRPFDELALPMASTMLRQAFGRLIRSETDTGVVAVLDNRLLTKSYGRTLLANLPPVRLAKSFARLNELTDKYELLKK